MLPAPDFNEIYTLNSGGGEVNTMPLPFEWDLTAMQLIPQNFRATILAADGVNFTWNPVANAAGYKIRRDGYPLDVGNKTSHPIGSLPLEKEFSFDICSYDANGKESAFSEPILVNPTLGTIKYSQTPKGGTRVIIRPTGGQSPNWTPPLPNGVTPTGTTTGTTTATTAQPAAEDLLFGFDRTTVFVVGGVAVGGLALYFLSGKK